MQPGAPTAQSALATLLGAAQDASTSPATPASPAMPATAAPTTGGSGVVGTLSDGLYILLGVLIIVVGLWSAMRGGSSTLTVSAMPAPA